MPMDEYANYLSRMLWLKPKAFTAAEALQPRNDKPSMQFTLLDSSLTLTRRPQHPMMPHHRFHHHLVH